MRKVLLLAALLAAGPATKPAPAAAEEPQPQRGLVAGDIEVRDAWVRLVPGGGPSAAYLALHNRGDEPAVLVGADCPAFGKVMLHRSVESGGTSRMEHVDRLAVPPGEVRRLAPGGYHLMLMDPRDPPAVGGELTITLRLADGRALEVPFRVEPPYSQGPQ